MIGYTEAIVMIGWIFIAVGATALYLAMWVGVCAAVQSELDDYNYVEAAIFLACLILYTGVGIMSISKVLT